MMFLKNDVSLQLIFYNMLKKIILLFVLSLYGLGIQAQSSDVKTVLFLVPFFGEDYPSHQSEQMNTPTDIYNEQIFSLISFWQGAKIALEEYESTTKNLEVIVRDVSYKDTKLEAILQNKQLMNKVDLIIGPFFAAQFTLAAQAAKEYKIPIVNPFAQKSSILNNNEYVYKVTPAGTAVCESVCRFLDNNKGAQLILWTDTEVPAGECKFCTDYLKEKNVPFITVNMSKNEHLLPKLSTSYKKVVLTFLDSKPNIISQTRLLGLDENIQNTTFFVPSEWLEMSELDADYLNTLNIHFVSNYFVDNEDAADLLFMSKFIEKYGTPPDLKTYSFQGYDITKYFIELMFHGFKATDVDFVPVASRFKFVKTPSGGYENHGVFTLMLKDYTIQLSE